MSLEQRSEEEDKFTDHVVVTKSFANHYFHSNKVKRHLAHLMHVPDVIVTLRENPESNQPFVEIEAATKELVEKAKMKILQALYNFSNRTSFSHLVTFPFTNETFTASYLKFKENVLNNFATCSGITEALFQNPKKLHLTVSVLTLVSEEQITKAKNILQEECGKLLASSAFNKKLQVKGLDIMNADPTKTNVLFAKIEDEGLQKLADAIAKEMLKSGFVFRDDKCRESQVKLHITLINTLYGRRKAWRDRKRKLNTRPVKYFDSSPLLEHYKDFVFAEMDLPCVQLNDISGENEQGYYKVIHSVQLANNQAQTEGSRSESK